MTITTEELDSRLRVIELEHSERKPIENLIKIFIYFLIAISVVLGVFGIKQFSDMEEIVSRQVKSEFPRDSQKYKEYEELLNATAKLEAEFSDIHGKYQLALENYEHLDKVSSDFDIEGKVERLIRESTERAEREIENGVLEGTLFEQKWRLAAISTLEVLAEAQKNRNFDSDFIFNAAQTCGRLKHAELGFKLMKAAYEKNPEDSPIKAAMLASEIALGDAEKSEEAFQNLLKMVENLDPNSPHIVLSEAWNGAEELRRHADLIAALNSLLSSERKVKPSYAEALLARAYLRASRPGDFELAKEALSNAKQRLLQESVLAVWNSSTLREIKRNELAITQTDLLRNVIGDEI
ncbi:M48 family metallopeptidase [Alcanivorax sp. NBRC 102028]|uniref:tetratricopeptide repeat protein n=1 Tax=Alcanivorax sp. NBRC 102028 TaxID=1113897 RepID=UPI000789DCF5|nr:hypothetical protein [Alcanivorax sp. NBRC 102028]